MEKKHTHTEKHSDTSFRPLMILGICVVVVSGLIALGLSSTWWLLSTYETRMAPNTTIAGINVSHATYAEAEAALQRRVDSLNAQGVTIEYDTHTADPISVSVLPENVPLSASGDVQILYTIDTKTTLDMAYAIGHENSIIARVESLLRSMIGGNTILARYSIDEDTVTDLLKTNFSQYETAPINATITIAEDGNIQINPDQSGITFNYPHIVDAIESRISALSSDTVAIAPEETAATTRSEDLENQRLTVEAYLEKSPVTLTWEDKTWTFAKKDISSWLTASSSGVSVDTTALDASLADVHATIDQDAVEGRYELDKDAGGAPVGIHEITPSQNGRSIDVTATAQAITDYLSGSSTGSVAITTSETLPAFAAANKDELQIHDILGTGHSNMAGSPTNRRKNIARGVELLNGLLIPPGENFSLVQSIKPFTLENGYVPELVIKGNKTEPEIGGGLCQVGTTLFRGAMESGLPIVSRSNHAYAVPYYSDDRNHLPGTDATIYDPNPDMVFTNDTPGYILLQTRIEGNDLYFDFWGTSDGRDGSFSAPTVSDYVAPPATKEIPTTALAPGERKCTESAHSGVTAQFTYTIKKADGTQIDRIFKSVYKPWQAVCLVGQSTDTSANNSSTNTNSSAQ